MLGAANRMGATLPPFELVLEMDMRLSVPYFRLGLMRKPLHEDRNDGGVRAMSECCFAAFICTNVFWDSVI